MEITKYFKAVSSHTEWTAWTEFVQLQVDEEPEDVQEISAAGDDELVAGDYEEPDADSVADSLPTAV